MIEQFFKFCVVVDVHKFKFVFADFFIAVDINVVGVIVRYKSDILFTVIFKHSHNLTFNFYSVIKLKSDKISLFDFRSLSFLFLR